MLRKQQTGVFHYDFYVNAVRYRGSTKTKLESKARKVEDRIKARAYERGPLFAMAKAPKLIEFGAKRFIPWVDESNRLGPKTRKYYNVGWELLKQTNLMYFLIDRITSDMIDRMKFVGKKKIEVSAAYRNQARRTLSRILHLAVDWKIMPNCPRVHLEPENERDELITPEREAVLLKHAGQTLADVIIMVQDTGGRPEEVFRIRIEDVHLDQQHIFNPYGKTKNSRRYLPISDRMVDLLERRCGDREDGWLFPSDSKCGHLTTVAKMFRIARKKAGVPSTVVLYSARHTFGTDLQGQSKNLAVTMKAMGHSSPKTTMRYQHPEYVEVAREAINCRNATNAVGQVLVKGSSGGLRESA
jgi:integrase